MKLEAPLQILGALALTAVLSGCGKPGAPGAPAITATTAAANAAPTGSASDGDSGTGERCIDPQRTPVAKADIDLYLDVMQAAAARVQHPTASDLEAIRKQKAGQAQLGAYVAANAPAQARADAQMQQLQAEMTTAMQHGDMDKLKALAAQEMKLGTAQQNASQLTQPINDATSGLAFNLTDGQADEVIVAERHLDQDHWDRLVGVIEEIFPPPIKGIADCGGSDCVPELTAEQVRCRHEQEASLARNRALMARYEKQIHALEAVVRAGKQ